MNSSHVVFEITCKGVAQRLTCGGTEADNQVVREGKISHMRPKSGGKDAENRWMVPEELIRLDAIWLSFDSFEYLFDMCMFEF